MVAAVGRDHFRYHRAAGYGTLGREMGEARFAPVGVCGGQAEGARLCLRLTTGGSGRASG